MCNWHVPVCATCKVDMKVEKTGVTFVEQVRQGDDARPYKMWSVDMWTCRSCKAQVLVGFGKGPYAFHHEETFKEVLKHVQELGDVVMEKV